MANSKDIDDQLVLQDFATLSQFGATAGGGVDRQAASVADGQQRRWFADWLQDRGFRVEFDRVGNQFGLLEVVPGAPYVLTGSHLDSQPLGGRYDGAYGVLASAHAAHRVAKRWAESGETPKYNLAVVNWFNEEGCRFKPSMMGSSVYTGKMELETALSSFDRGGITVRDALNEIECVGSFDGPTAAAYAEIHIEQGRSLENDGITIGLVDSTWAAHKYQLVVHGAQSHTGSTIMADRRDALLGASMLVLAARELADDFASAPLHTSVSQMNIEPNSPVVVAREVGLHLDLRSPNQETLDLADQRLSARFEEIEKRAQVKIEKVTAHSWGVANFHPDGVKLSMNLADSLGLSHREIMTVAGHDSVNMKDVVPTVMLFVPSVDGISHNEGEFTQDSDVCAGVDLLTETLDRLAHGALTDID
ncbi:M20 family metallo-hydrolase [Rhodococcus qingshengii]|uniref:M20 family metallo-hydrolase n=1 Tax=Rhodococcus qingshengii TaxID=334542 RepID=UPI0024BA020E|nr:M20 family metallo-hydrolase [Rhodococcus qingshengii]MDJ0441495.1 M20 family metallo-hydrolase [Rhodococcus qingshengii]